MGLLEANIIGGASGRAQGVSAHSDPGPHCPNATATHEALLMLGKCREGRTRLITTNFDRLFEEVIEKQSLPVKRFQAPLLPVPKNRWDGLVIFTVC